MPLSKPVREIGVATRGVTGVVPGFGAYESSLERDLMELLRFDGGIEKFVPQPLTIDYLDENGKARRYTPDGLIYFKPDDAGAVSPLLVEVKYRADFRNDWRNLIRKFRAAKAFCRDHYWQFEVFTEKEIRTPYLSNAKFLWPYSQQKFADAEISRVLTALSDLEQADPDLLLCALYFDPMNRARAIPLLWHLIAVGAVGCDLSQPLTMRSPIWTEHFE